jgi:hypothetical protein
MFQQQSKQAIEKSNEAGTRLQRISPGRGQNLFFLETWITTV